MLFHWTDNGDIESVGTKFVIETRKWFDSVWNSIAVEVPRCQDARDLLLSARAVLLDFDGPVTPLMPAPLNM